MFLQIQIQILLLAQTHQQDMVIAQLQGTSNYQNAPQLPKWPSKLLRCPMEKRNAPELGVLYYYKHFLKIV